MGSLCTRTSGSGCTKLKNALNNNIEKYKKIKLYNTKVVTLNNTENTTYTDALIARTKHMESRQCHYYHITL